MHIPTILSVTDVDEHLAAPRLFDRASVDIRDLSRAETQRSAQAGRNPSRTTPLNHATATGGPSTLLFALGGIALAVLMVAIFHIIAFALDLSDVRDFVAPTAAEARAHGWQALSERAAP